MGLEYIEKQSAIADAHVSIKQLFVDEYFYFNWQ